MSVTMFWGKCLLSRVDASGAKLEGEAFHGGRLISQEWIFKTHAGFREMSVTMFGSEGLEWFRSHKISNLRDEVGLSGLTMPCEKNLEIVICTLNMSTSMFGGEGLYICVKGSPEHQNSSKVSLGWSVLNFRKFYQFCNFSLFHQKWAIFLFSDKKL